MRKTLKKLIGMLLTIILVMNVFLEKVPVDAAEISDSRYNITLYTNDDSNKAFKLHVPSFQVKHGEGAFIGVEMNQGYEFLDVYDKNNGEKYSFNRESNNIVTINFLMPNHDVDLLIDVKAVGSYFVYIEEPRPNHVYIEKKSWFFPGDEITIYNTVYNSNTYRFGYYMVADYDENSSANLDYKRVDGDKIIMPENDICISAKFYSTAEHTITLADCTNGYLSLSPEKDYYCEGDVVTVTAHPDENYRFSQIEGVPDGTFNGNSYTFEMINADLNISAEFKSTYVNITASRYPLDAGTVTLEKGENGTVIFTAQPIDGYELAGWFKDGDLEGDPVSTDNPYVLQPTEDTYLVAYFKEKTYNITTDYSVFYGSVTVSPGKTGLKEGDIITVNATPRSDRYELDYIKIRDIVDGQRVNERVLEGNTFVMPANDVSIEVNFKLKQLKVGVSANSDEMGRVTGGGVYGYNKYINVRAIPFDGYRFLYWLEDGLIVSPQNIYSFYVTKNRELVAVFEPIAPKYTVNLQNYTDATTVIDGVTDGEKKNGELTFTVNSDRACVVCVSTDGGETQTRINPEKINDTTYSFTVDVQSDILISVIYRGDMNLDTRIDSADALLVLRYDVNKAQNLSALQIEAGKVSDDEKVNSADALMILRYDVNKGSIYWE